MVFAYDQAKMRPLRWALIQCKSFNSYIYIYKPWSYQKLGERYVTSCPSALRMNQPSQLLGFKRQSCFENHKIAMFLLDILEHFLVHFNKQASYCNIPAIHFHSWSCILNEKSLVKFSTPKKDQHHNLCLLICYYLTS